MKQTILYAFSGRKFAWRNELHWFHYPQSRHIDILRRHGVKGYIGTLRRNMKRERGICKGMGARLFYEL